MNLGRWVSPWRVSGQSNQNTACHREQAGVQPNRELQTLSRVPVSEFLTYLQRQDRPRRCLLWLTDLFRSGAPGSWWRTWVGRSIHAGGLEALFGGQETHWPMNTWSERLWDWGWESARGEAWVGLQAAR